MDVKKVFRIPCDSLLPTIAEIPLVLVGPSDICICPKDCSYSEKELSHFPDLRFLDEKTERFSNFSWEWRSLIGLPAEKAWEPEYWMYLCEDEKAGMYISPSQDLGLSRHVP